MRATIGRLWKNLCIGAFLKTDFSVLLIEKKKKIKINTLIFLGIATEIVRTTETYNMIIQFLIKKKLKRENKIL